MFRVHVPYRRARERAVLDYLCIRNPILTLWFVGISAAVFCSPLSAVAEDLRERPVFRSENGILDLLMIAEPAPVSSISFIPPQRTKALHPTGWVYEICSRNEATKNNRCPLGSKTAAPYGGVRLALQQGDALKIRLVNRLPKLDPEKLTHSLDPGGDNLWRNLTNLHTHGLVVPARAPTVNDPTFGDYIFVQIYNPANGIPTPVLSTVTVRRRRITRITGSISQRITFPVPTGFIRMCTALRSTSYRPGFPASYQLVWQVITFQTDASKQLFPEHAVRHLILKDMQVVANSTIKFHHGEGQTVFREVADGEVLNQEDPVFCNQRPSELRHGSCPGADNTTANDNNLDNSYLGGRWYFTVNGQEYPTIPISNPEGELWRLTNASGASPITYN